MNEKIWTVEDAAKILDIQIKAVYRRAYTRGIRVLTKRTTGKGRALIYSDADIESMRVDLRGRKKNALKSGKK